MLYNVSEKNENIAKFRCIKSCGYCCYESPELFNKEIEVFKNKTKLIQSRDQFKGTQYRFINGSGGCIHLNRKNMQCEIYTDRPVHCILYPVRIFVGSEISVLIDYSCPGLWNEGNRSVNDAVMCMEKAMIKQISEDIISIHKKSMKIYNDFWKLANREYVNFIKDIMINWRSKEYCELLLDADITGNAEDDFKGQKVTCKNDEKSYVLDFIRYLSSDKNNFFVSTSGDYLSIEKRGNKIYLMKMDKENGSKEPVKKKNSDDLSFLEMEPDAKKLFEWYGDILSKREMTVGIAADILDNLNYKHDLNEIFTATWSTFMLDTVAASSVIAHLDEKKLIDRPSIISGISYHEGIYYRKGFIGYLI